MSSPTSFRISGVGTEANELRISGEPGILHLKAGCPGRVWHDSRRTAVRNVVNRGVPERVAMTVTGHKARSVIDRYHIVSPTDLQEVARKLTAHLRAQSSTRCLTPTV